MNKGKLPKLKNQQLRIRPVVRRFDDLGHELAPIDNIWSVSAATEAGVTLSNESTGHYLSLNADNIHEYQSDPTGKNQGFLILNAEVFIQGLQVRVEPRDPRGSPTYVPVRRVLPQPTLQLEREERDILIAASNDGLITIIRTEQLGDWVRAGPCDFVDQNDRAIAAGYLDAIRSLVGKQLARNLEHESFELTKQGFRVARELATSQPMNGRFMLP